MGLLLWSTISRREKSLTSLVFTGCQALFSVLPVLGADDCHSIHLFSCPICPNLLRIMMCYKFISGTSWGIALQKWCYKVQEVSNTETGSFRVGKVQCASGVNMGQHLYQGSCSATLRSSSSRRLHDSGLCKSRDSGYGVCVRDNLTNVLVRSM